MEFDLVKKICSFYIFKVIIRLLSGDDSTIENRNLEKVLE